MGCAITLAHTYDEALQQWDEDSHDLLITSLELADKDGYQLAQTLRNQGCCSPIVGIINQSEEQTRCLRAGMNATLTYSVDSNTLYNLLHQLACAPIPKRYRAIFRQTMSTDLAILEQALRDTHYDTAQIVLHRMAGALATMGMQNMADAMYQLKDLLNRATDDYTIYAHATALSTALRDVIEHT